MLVIVIVGALVVIAASLVSSFFEGRRTVRVGDGERAYQLFVPAGYDTNQPVPLLLVYHMRDGFGWLMQEVTGFNAIAEREGFIVAYPDGVGRSWADGSGRYAADSAEVDDVAFTAALIDQLSAQYRIDLNRVYTAGFDNGGMLALRLGCELPDRIAAVASVSGTLAENVKDSCSPPRPVPVLMMHGMADEVLPLDGLPGLTSVPEALLTWVLHNGCDSAPVLEQRDPVADGTSVRRELYVGCRDGVEVWYDAIAGGGHRWPGSHSIWQVWLPGPVSGDIDASAEIWDFFDSYALAGF